MNQVIKLSVKFVYVLNGIIQTTYQIIDKVACYGKCSEMTVYYDQWLFDTCTQNLFV